MMLLQSIIFSYMFRNDIPNFPLYLICGNTLFTFFNETTSTGLTSVIQNAPLIKKVYIPKVHLPHQPGGFPLCHHAVQLWCGSVGHDLYPCHLLLDHLFELAAAGAALSFQLRAWRCCFPHWQYFPRYGCTCTASLTMAWMYATPLFTPSPPCRTVYDTDRS